MYGTCLVPRISFGQEAFVCLGIANGGVHTLACNGKCGGFNDRVTCKNALVGGRVKVECGLLCGGFVVFRVLGFVSLAM